jgi:hypothetical protein
MRMIVGLLVIVSVAVFVGFGPAQTTLPAKRKGILPPEAYLADRGSNLEQELRRLKESEAVMGPSHPRLPGVQKRIAECEQELSTLLAIPNPLARMEEEGVDPREIVEQISDKELRGLAVRLALDLRDLRKRVEALERANPSR